MASSFNFQFHFRLFQTWHKFCIDVGFSFFFILFFLLNIKRRTFMYLMLDEEKILLLRKKSARELFNVVDHAFHQSSFVFLLLSFPMFCLHPEIHTWQKQEGELKQQKKSSTFLFHHKNSQFTVLFPNSGVKTKKNLALVLMLLQCWKLSFFRSFFTFSIKLLFIFMCRFFATSFTFFSSFPFLSFTPTAREERRERERRKTDIKLDM